jgi:hypothetical protein
MSSPDRRNARKNPRAMPKRKGRPESRPCRRRDGEMGYSPLRYPGTQWGVGLSSMRIATSDGGNIFNSPCVRLRFLAQKEKPRRRP